MAFNLGLNSPGLVSGGSHKPGDNVGSNSSHRALLTTSDGSNFLKRRREVGLISFGKNSLCLFDNDATVEGSLQLAHK
jgi:hypothetical protein